jgi:hypothetical protein
VVVEPGQICALPDEGAAPPGATLTDVAPETSQLRVVQDPAVILAGLAEKALITGGVPLGALDSMGNGEDGPEPPWSPGGETGSGVDSPVDGADGVRGVDGNCVGSGVGGVSTSVTVTDTVLLVLPEALEAVMV